MPQESFSSRVVRHPKPEGMGDVRSVERTLLRRGTKYDVELASVRGRDGTWLTRELIRHPGSVIVLPILVDQDGAGSAPRVVLIRNWRLSLEQRILELPAGTRTTGEDPMTCAARELEEETGYRARTLEPLGSFWTAPGLTDERMHAFVARGLTPMTQRLENDEDITTVVTQAREALAMTLDGRICDAKTMLVLRWAQAAGHLATQ